MRSHLRRTKGRHSLGHRAMAKEKSTPHLIGFDVPGVMLIDDLHPAAATRRHVSRSLTRPSRGATWIGRPVSGCLAVSGSVTLRRLSQLGLAPLGNHDGPTPTMASFIVVSHRCLPVRQVAKPGHNPGKNEGPWRFPTDGDEVTLSTSAVLSSGPRSIPLDPHGHMNIEEIAMNFPRESKTRNSPASRIAAERGSGRGASDVERHRAHLRAGLQRQSLV